MIDDLKSAITRDPVALARDFAGASALAVVVVAGLFLPGLV